MYAIGEYGIDPLNQATNIGEDSPVTRFGMQGGRCARVTETRYFTRPHDAAMRTSTRCPGASPLGVGRVDPIQLDKGGAGIPGGTFYVAG